jgi:hypothetical protein
MPGHIVGAMAARRLLIIMLVLLGVSTLAAAMIDTSSFRDEGTGSTVASETATEASVPEDTVPEGSELKPVIIEVYRAPVTVIPVRLGDQLPLIVRARKADLVEIPALGLLEPVDSRAPARFDVFADATGNYGIRLVNADRVVGRIEVRKRGTASPPAAATGDGPE